jgi:hypothetical protein
LARGRRDSTQFIVGISCATTPAGRTRTTHLDTHMAGTSSTIVYLACSAIDYEYHGLESWASSRNCISTVGLWRVWKEWHLHIQLGGGVGLKMKSCAADSGMDSPIRSKHSSAVQLDRNRCSHRTARGKQNLIKSKPLNSNRGW